MMKPLVIFYTAIFSSTGGGQHAMSLLARELKQRGYEIELYTRPPLSAEHRYVQWLKEYDIPIRVFPRFEEFKAVKIGSILVALLMTLPYAMLRRRSLGFSSRAAASIFLTMISKLERKYIYSQLSSRVQGLERKAIFQIWGPAALTPLLLEWAEKEGVASIYHEMGEGDETYIKTWHLEPTVESINRAREIICCSESVAESIRRVYGYRGKITTIPFMIMDPGDLWQRGQKTNGRTTFGAIGRLVPHKRHADLLHALKKLMDRGYDAGLVIAGKGPMRAPLEELTDQLNLRDRVTFTGEFEKLEDVMAQFDVFTLTSSSESQCMPITESMSYGKPVVASDFGGIPDFVEDGVTGFLVPVGDVDKLVEAMQTLISDNELRQIMGRRGRELYEAKYSPEKITDAMEQAYAYLENGWPAKN